MLKRIAIGAVAGAVATLPMSGVIWGFRRLGIYHSKPAPEVVSEETSRPAVHPSRLQGPAGAALKTVQHFGFGAAAGAVFGLLTIIIRPSILTGLIAGLAIWKGTYDGVIPAMGIMPPPQQDEQGRVLTMIAAHAAYGAALGETVKRITAQPHMG